jgi:phage major head subunit gpT-like protein
MQINATNMTDLTRSYRSNFNTGFSEAASQYMQVATVVPSSAKENVYPWLGRFPGMREWLGERVIKNVSTHRYALANRKWEETISVERDDIEDDQYGTYAPMMQAMGDAAATQPDQLVFGVVKAGFTSFCFDGQYFFDTDHPVKNADGTMGSKSNLYAGAARPWYLLDTTRPLKPFLFQDRRRPEFIAKDKITDDNYFLKDQYLYGSSSRNNAGYGFWQMCFASRESFTEANFEKVFTDMSSQVGDEGRPLAIRPNVLLVSTLDEIAAEKILKAVARTGGETNVNLNRVRIITSPWLL